MARKDLTALAALGTLGYMLSKKGDKKDEKQTTTTTAAERREAAEKTDSESPVISDETIKRNTSGMDVQDESGMVNKRLKRNPETGELYDTEVSAPSKKPAASPAKPSSGAAKNLTTSESQAARNALGEGSYRQDSVYSPDKKGITSETRVPRFTPDGPPVQTGRRDKEDAPRGKIDVTKYSLAERNKMPSDRAPTDYRPVNERFGKGGKVKKMASGGMTSSASKRADGIAVKGKTRGKMY
jgi:hypothetical protein